MLPIIADHITRVQVMKIIIYWSVAYSLIPYIIGRAISFIKCCNFCLDLYDKPSYPGIHYKFI